MATNRGDGGRQGAVKNRAQLRNPITGNFIKLDTSTGRILEEKKTPGPYKGVRNLSPTTTDKGGGKGSLKGKG